MIAYRIVEDHGDGVYKTLFHGVDGSKVIPMNKWITANEKMVKDGTSNTYYLSGFHSLETIEELIDYMKSFKNRLDMLKIAKITISDVRLKEHSRSKVFLSKHMKLMEVLDIDWRNYKG